MFEKTENNPKRGRYDLLLKGSYVYQKLVQTSQMLSHSEDLSDQDFSHSVSLPHGFLGPI